MALHPLDQHASVPGSVEQGDLAALRQPFPETLHIVLLRFDSIGAPIGQTFSARGSSAQAMRRMVPPLPAASMPSNTTTARSPWKRMACWMRTSRC